MKTIVSMPKAAVEDAINAQIKILARKANNEPNGLIKEIVEKDLREFKAALLTLTETK